MGLPGSKSQGSLFAPIRVVAAADDSAVGSLGSGIGERSILHFLSNCMRNTSDPMVNTRVVLETYVSTCLAV